ncbi:TetR/AcrR family transcriptional regulator [Microbacterium jejuense]|uniref:TetR/AcrR family transcriptional regulator n=1 Tax=Microbacterium jejuense TaxID=1263637 RepID=A0ABS7HNP1_9MICO|nr:TetR/AcrR family transcriptional regulator [Microbacterium jejuense]MBW9093866.1 TetR/AcrR family transcriptional regulator [Microbacterium jejuense]
MPTGRALEDARSMLLETGRRILAAEGTGGLTSRSVTDRAGVAKGVLHRHFADFDAYLAALVTDDAARIRSIEPRSAGSTVDAVTDVVEQVFTPTTRALVALVISRDEVRRRVRSPGSYGIPLLMDATAVVMDVLAAGREVGWIRRDADVAALALALIGSAHLLYAGELGAFPDHSATHEVVESILVGSL